MARILVLYYSAGGHTELMALAEAAGARKVPGAQVAIKRVASIKPRPEPKPGTPAAKIPIAEPLELKDYDAIIFGSPTRFGTMCSDMRHFIDQTGPLWEAGALIGKIGSAFTSTSTQHGGAETTLTSFHTTLLHHGMIVVGLTYAEAGLMEMKEVCGGSPYGASTISGIDETRQPSDNEFDLAEAQGKRVAELAVKLFG